jgi:hypothetical protein
MAQKTTQPRNNTSKDPPLGAPIQRLKIQKKEVESKKQMLNDEQIT